MAFDKGTAASFSTTQHRGPAKNVVRAFIVDCLPLQEGSLDIDRDLMHVHGTAF
jgi:hypothetical protein